MHRADRGQGAGGLGDTESQSMSSVHLLDLMPCPRPPSFLSLLGLPCPVAKAIVTC
jgi:hypothetical protein